MTSADQHDPKVTTPAKTTPGAMSREDYYVRVWQSAEFRELRRRYRRFVIPVTVVSLLWYFLYVLLANYAQDFMSTKVVGNINVALIFGLLQFASTFLIAWWYARRAGRDFDPVADELRLEFEQANDGTPR